MGESTSVGEAPQDGGRRGRSILLVTSGSHGHRTYGVATRLALERAGAQVDHVSVELNGLSRLLAHGLERARGHDLASFRRQLALDARLHALARARMAPGALVHVMPLGLAHAFAIARRRQGGTLTIGLDTTSDLMRSEFHMGSLSERLRRRSELDTFSESSYAIALSCWAADSVRAMSPRLPVAIVPPSAPALPVVTARRLAGPVRVAMVGSPWRRKGGDRISRWLDECAGSAELHVICRDVPRRIASRADVVVVPPMERDRLLREFLPSCDVFVLPSLVDQSPWVLAEAAAAGLPVVASRVGAVSEIVVDGVTGLLVDRADDRGFIDAVQALVEDGPRRRAMGDRAREYARTGLDEQRNFDRVAALLLQLRSDSADGG